MGIKGFYLKKRFLNFRGSPRPKIMWKREDGDLIRYDGGSVSTVDGNSLVFASTSRAQVGEYLCIASNGVPPSISKRIVLRVQCKWIIRKLFKAVPVQCKVPLHFKLLLLQFYYVVYHLPKCNRFLQILSDSIRFFQILTDSCRLSTEYHPQLDILLFSSMSGRFRMAWSIIEIP